MESKKTDVKKMHIKYVFTEDEKKEIAGDLAMETTEKQSLELQKKESASQFKSQIDSCDAKINMLSRQYSQGYDFRSHDCYEILDFEGNQVFTHRADTDEMLSKRQMTASELQKEMFDKNGLKIVDPAPDENSEYSEAVQMAIRFKSEYPAQFIQACEELSFRNDPEKLVDVTAIAVCDLVKKIMDNEGAPVDDYEKLAEGESTDE